MCEYVVFGLVLLAKRRQGLFVQAHAPRGYTRFSATPGKRCGVQRRHFYASGPENAVVMLYSSYDSRFCIIRSLQCGGRARLLPPSSSLVKTDRNTSIMQTNVDSTIILYHTSIIASILPTAKAIQMPGPPHIFFVFSFICFSFFFLSLDGWVTI